MKIDLKSLLAPPRNENFRTDIAGIRGIAVMLVVFCHFEIPGFGGGFIGPDLFFVLSGYLITGLLVKEYKKKINTRTGSGTISIGAFYLRRTRRILPASLFVLLCINIYARLNMNVLQVAQIKTDSVWTLLFGANINFLRQSTDYFAQNNAVSPLQHYWSLSLEEQFYFVWPALFLMAVSFQRISFRGRVFDWQQRLRAVFITIGIGSFVWMLVEFQSSRTTAYFSTFSRAWELALGGVLSMLSVQGLAAKFGRAWTVLRGLALVAMVGSIAVVTPTNFAHTLFIPALATGFLLISGVQSKGDPVYRLLSLKLITAPGAISFSVYLWHWPVFVFGRNLDLMNTISQRLVGVVVCIALGTLTYWLVERTFLKIPLPKLKPRPNYNGRAGLASSRILTTSATLLVVAGLGFVTYPSASASEGNKVTAWVPPASAAIYAPEAAKIAIITSEQNKSDNSDREIAKEWFTKVAQSTLNKEIPKDLDNPVNAINSDGKWNLHGRDCMGITKQTTGCDNGTSVSNQSNEAPKIVLLGDSYATALIPAVIGAFNLNKWNIRGFAKSECMVADTVASIERGKLFPECNMHRQWVFAEVKKMAPNLVIVQQRATTNYVGDESDFAKGMVKSVRLLGKYAKKVVVIGTMPSSGNLLKCLTRDGKLPPSCFSYSQSSSRLLEKEATMLNDQVWIDPVSWLCFKNICPPIIDNTIVFSDGNHLTTWFSAKLAPLLRESLIENGIEP